MSNTKNWEIDQSKRKDQHSIYLTDDDWAYLMHWSKGSPTKIIREMIASRRGEEECEKNP